MIPVYSSHEAKTKFNQILRQVLSGQRVVVAYEGEEVAEIRPIEKGEPSLERRLRRLEAEGILGPPASPHGRLRPVARRHGALKRFLDSRD